jgi:hypothetical protein
LACHTVAPTNIEIAAASSNTISAASCCQTKIRFELAGGSAMYLVGLLDVAETGGELDGPDGATTTLDGVADGRGRMVVGVVA